MWHQSSSVYSPVVYKLRHVYEIKKFSDLLLTCPTGHPVQSTFFGDNCKDKDCQYFINVYPAGSKTIFKDCISVFVHVRSSEQISVPDKNRHRRFCFIQFSLMDSSGKETLIRTASNSLSTAPANMEKHNWGYRRFCTRSEARGFLKEDGSLRLVCSMIVVIPPSSPIHSCVCPNIEKEVEEEWKDSFLPLLGGRPDWNFTVWDASGENLREEFQVHKHVLAAQSPVFHTMTTANMIEATENAVEIKDTSPDAFTSLISFLYSGRCPSDLDPSLCAKLLKLADKYNIESLGKVCEHRIVQGLNCENVMEVVMELNPLLLSSIDKKATEILCNDWNRIKQTETWKDLVSSSPQFAFSLLEKIVDNCLN